MAGDTVGEALWEMLEFTPAHLTYLLLPLSLILYVLGANWIRNVLHLSEPPIALLAGIILGPRCLGWLQPNLCSSRGCRQDGSYEDGVGGWGWDDNSTHSLSFTLHVHLLS